MSNYDLTKGGLIEGVNICKSLDEMNKIISKLPCGYIVKQKNNKVFIKGTNQFVKL